MTLQWRCKQSMPHPSCEATDWRFYKEMPEEKAKEFMEQMADKSTHFEYRVKPEDANENV